jgi:hypothetical protein
MRMRDSQTPRDSTVALNGSSWCGHQQMNIQIKPLLNRDVYRGGKKCFAYEWSSVVRTRARPTTTETERHLRHSQDKLA